MNLAVRLAPPSSPRTYLWLLFFLVLYPFTFSNLLWAWSDPPPLLRRPLSPSYPVVGSVFKTDPRSIEHFLQTGEWVDYAFADRMGDSVIKLFRNKGLAPPSTVGFYARIKDLPSLKGPNQRGYFTIYTEGVIDPISTRMHELGHLWIDLTRTAYNLPKLSGPMEEVLLISGQLRNPRRRALMKPDEFFDSRNYLQFNLNKLSDQEILSIPEIYPRYTRHYDQLMQQGTLLGDFYRKNMGRIIWEPVNQMDDAIMLGNSMKSLAGLRFDRSVGIFAVAETLSIHLDYSGNALAKLGARHEYSDLVFAGALVAKLGHTIFPTVQSSPISLNDAMSTAVLSGPQSGVARDVLIGRDNTLAGHMHSEAAMNKRVGYHSGWCAYSCSAGCPNSYPLPSLPLQWWHGVAGSPATPGSQWDRRTVCPVP